MRAEDVVQPDSNTTIVSLGISVSHVSSGLPFDFSLQSGLVKVQASGGSSRRLAAREQHTALRSTARSTGGSYRTWFDEAQNQKRLGGAKTSCCLWF